MHYSKEEKAMWVEDWRQSGKSAWAYAKENGLVPQTFLHWTKPSNTPQQPLVEVPTPTLQSIRLVQEILIERGDLRIRMPLEPVLGELRNLIGKLGRTV